MKRLAGVHSKCWIFPDPNSRRSGRGPELLEVLLNRPSVATNTSVQA